MLRELSLRSQGASLACTREEGGQWAAVALAASRKAQPNFPGVGGGTMGAMPEDILARFVGPQATKQDPRTPPAAALEPPSGCSLPSPPSWPLTLAAVFPQAIRVAAAPVQVASPCGRTRRLPNEVGFKGLGEGLMCPRSRS